MQIDLRKILTIIFLAIVSYVVMFILFSCSANYHLSKFVKKGGKISNDTTIVTYADTIRINGKDSIVYRDTRILCPELEAPKTRFETRIKYKYLRNIKKDSMEHEIKMLKERNDFVMDSLENDKKVRRIEKNNNKNELKGQKKIETKNNKTINLALIVVGLITLTILAFKFSK